MAKAHYTDLPPWERAAYYRRMALDTEALGKTGSPEFRRTCREFAARWRLLANELMMSGFEEWPEDAGRIAGRQFHRPSAPPQFRPIVD